MTVNKNTEVVVEIGADGNFNFEVLNGDGKTCTALTKPLEEAVGVVTEREFKPEHNRIAPLNAQSTKKTQLN